MSLTLAQLDELERIARAADQGDWHCCLGSGECVMTGVSMTGSDGKSLFIADCAPDYALDQRPGVWWRENMVHIAAFDPPTVLALIELARQALAPDEVVIDALLAGDGSPN